MKKILVLAVLSILALTYLSKNTSAQVNLPTFKIPEKVFEIAPGVYSLGNATDIDGKKVEGIMLVKRKSAQNSRVGGAKAKSNQCYAYLGGGAKWKTQENYLVDPDNTASLSGELIHQIISDAISEWETAANFNISGSEGSGTVDGADETAPDGKNEVTFGSVSDSGVIAVTIVWGIFSGPPQGRYLAEWDQVYNHSDFAWSTTAGGEAGKMDLENIATHEIGHALGMGHPSDACSDETMYRYATEGEIKKRDLNPGDILGIDKLY